MEKGKQMHRSWAETEKKSNSVEERMTEEVCLFVFTEINAITKHK